MSNYVVSRDYREQRDLTSWFEIGFVLGSGYVRFGLGSVWGRVMLGLVWVRFGVGLC